MYKSTKIMKTFKLVRNRKQTYDEKDKRVETAHFKCPRL